jgi:hypothetical protein
MKIPTRLQEFLYRRAQPKLRKNARTYVAHGDNMWGNAITHRDPRELTGLFGNYLGSSLRVSGHIMPRPTNGDKLLVKMKNGPWGVFVLTKVDLSSNPRDQFFAVARGPLEFVPAGQEPQTKIASEFLRRGALA